jgi:O-methyltransferase
VTGLRGAVMRGWARRVRPRLPRRLLASAAVLCRALGLDLRFLHWLIPASPADGFVTETPGTPPALYRSLRRIAEAGPIGDYYEFGLYRGYTFWFAQQAAHLLGLVGMQFFGFDSFQGLPEPEGIDAALDEFHKGDYSCGRPTVVGTLRRFGFEWSRAQLVEGFYADSLRPALVRDLSMGPVAVALIDCDLYESTVPVMRFLAPLLQEGAILLFDDWNCFGASDEHGQRRAFREFLFSSPAWRAEPYLRFGWHGQGFILRHANAE